MRSWLAIGLVLVIAGCSPVAYDPNAYDPNAIFVDVTVVPIDPEVGETVTFTVSAHAVEKVLVRSSIDFDGDGVWDESRDNADTTVGERYTHVYTGAATYQTRARVVAHDGTTKARTTELTVQEVVWRAVYAVAQAEYLGPYIGGLTAASCDAVGEPFTWPDSVSPIPGGAGLTLGLGDYRRGATAEVSQILGQSRWATTPSGDFPYSCNFTLTLHAKHAGQDVGFVVEHCGTTSTDPYDPGRLRCLVDAKGEVP